jgi:hypothetical protein
VPRLPSADATHCEPSSSLRVPSPPPRTRVAQAAEAQKDVIRRWDTEQLLKSLHLGRIAEILDEELANADKLGSSYQEVLVRLLRAQWHKTLKSDAIRVKALADSDEARRVIAAFVEHYNGVRLHSAIGYVAPVDYLAGRENDIWTARDTKLEAARELRRQRRAQRAA